MYNFGSYYGNYGHAPIYAGSFLTGGSYRPQTTLVPKYVPPTFNLSSYSTYKPYVPAVSVCAKTTAKKNVCATTKTCAPQVPLYQPSPYTPYTSTYSRYAPYAGTYAGTYAGYSGYGLGAYSRYGALGYTGGYTNYVAPCTTIKKTKPPTHLAF